jgi:hypothetical protein
VNGCSASIAGHEVGIEEYHYARNFDRSFTRISDKTAWISNSECVKLSRKAPTKFVHRY